MAAWFSRRSWGRNVCRSLAPCKRIPISKLIREIFVCGIWRDPANFCSGIRNPGIWNLECAQGIRNLTNDWDPESKLSFIDKESGIHGLKSRIQDCLRFPYIWQKSMIQLRWSRGYCALTIYIIGHAAEPFVSTTSRNFNLDDFYNASLCFFPGIVVGVFYLCWIPFMVAVILSAFYKNLVTPVVVLVISTLVYSNSAMNPILYGYLNREFRLAYKRLFPKVSWPCKWMVHVNQGRLRSYDLSTFSVGDVTGHSQVHVGEGTVPCDSAF